MPLSNFRCTLSSLTCHADLYTRGVDDGTLVGCNDCAMCVLMQNQLVFPASIASISSSPAGAPPTGGGARLLALVVSLDNFDLAIAVHDEVLRVISPLAGMYFARDAFCSRITACESNCCLIMLSQTCLVARSPTGLPNVEGSSGA